MNDATLILVVLGATWGAMFQVMKIVEMLNRKRDLVLDINEKGCRLTASQKLLLLWSDFIPIWLGLMFFLLIFGGGFAVLPTILAERGFNVKSLEAGVCYAAACFAGFAFLVEVVAGIAEVRRMRARIAEPSKVSPPT